jgi:hypothetical protein
VHTLEQLLGGASGRAMAASRLSTTGSMASAKRLDGELARLG